MEEQVGGGSNGIAKSPQKGKGRACMGHSKTYFIWIIRFVRLGPAPDD